MSCDSQRYMHILICPVYILILSCVCVFLDGVLDLRLEVVTTNNYNTIANFYTLQIATAHANSFQPAFTSRFQVTDINNGDFSIAPTKFSLHRHPYT
jgi:hypothetical protein